ncbi:MAG: hypothetical protein CTY20_08685 [Hyphomicrobium sp.]|nr:MAG: hypothetical protein CTY20_08685 [Hyphomicrobium sp.]
MTVFKDIGGWREELEQLRNGPAYKTLYKQKIWNPKGDPLIPKSVILDFVETLLAHEETRKALLDLNRWHKANPPETNPDPDNDPTFPHNAANLQTEFLHWYMLKTGAGPRSSPFFTGLDIAVQILNCEIPDIRSSEAETYLRRTAKIHIDFDR